MAVGHFQGAKFIRCRLIAYSFTLLYVRDYRQETVQSERTSCELLTPRCILHVDYVIFVGVT